MEKKILITGTIFFLFANFIWASSMFKGETLTAKEVKAKWGQIAAPSSQFKAAKIDERAPMAYNIMTDKSNIGKTVAEIREDFGDPDGFYFIDSYPAYLIQERKEFKGESWQIVFRLNSKHLVRDIIVHKNCCAK